MATTSIQRVSLAALLGLATGCATISESKQQLVTVRTIQDHREIEGAGCILSNDAGRWFVKAPGRVTIQKSAGNLLVDCKKAGVSSGQETFASRPNISATFGNVLSGGLGYYHDMRTGAGFDYPEPLTVLMKQVGGDAQEAPAPPVGTPVY